MPTCSIWDAFAASKSSPHRRHHRQRPAQLRRRQARPAALRDKSPDEVVIPPWNTADEVQAQLADLAERGTRFVTAVPTSDIC